MNRLLSLLPLLLFPSPLCLAMSDTLKDHTKSLQPYAAILVSHEEKYRQLSGRKRDAVVAQIGEEITEEAAGNAAAVTSGAALHKVCLQL